MIATTGTNNNSKNWNKNYKPKHDLLKVMYFNYNQKSVSILNYL